MTIVGVFARACIIRKIRTRRYITICNGWVTGRIAAFRGATIWATGTTGAAV